MWWTQRGDRASAKLAESRHAAEALTIAVLRHLRADLVKLGRVDEASLEAWQEAYWTHWPVLIDSELSYRVQEVGGDWTILRKWMATNTGHGSYGPLYVDDNGERARAAYVAVLERRTTWLVSSLIAHRRGDNSRPTVSSRSQLSQHRRWTVRRSRSAPAPARFGAD